MPRIGYVWNDFENKEPKPMYYYWTQGVAVTEVELDILTGDHHVLRTDIMMVNLCNLQPTRISNSNY